jgi:malate synthase
MAAQIPLKDPIANAVALAKVTEDKRREVRDGHDGTWVAHPALVPVAQQIFNEGMPGPHQLSNLREDVAVTREMLLAAPGGTRTYAGLRHNVRVGIQYLHSWLQGLGCVPLYGLMEDAATAEIARTQVWQWLHHDAALDDGRVVTPALVRQVLHDEGTQVRESLSDSTSLRRFDDAVEIFERVATSDTLEEFLTLPAYNKLITYEGA